MSGFLWSLFSHLLQEGRALFENFLTHSDKREHSAAEKPSNYISCNWSWMMQFKEDIRRIVALLLIKFFIILYWCKIIINHLVNKTLLYLVSKTIIIKHVSLPATGVRALAMATYLVFIYLFSGTAVPLHEEYWLGGQKCC